MSEIDQAFRQITDQLLKNSQQQQAVDSDRVFQPANLTNRALVETIVSRLILPGSTINGYENLRELHRRSQAGESCLLLLEHYSNFDIPCLFILAKQHADGVAVTDSIIAMAGHKLNEESKFVLAFTEAYTRIVIYPARKLHSLEGSEEFEAERTRSRELNRSALREMVRTKHSGNMILLFPAGTRFRPGVPESKQILLETDSYIKGFDHMVMIGIAGNTLEVNAAGDMAKDVPKTDVIVYNVSPVTSCADFRARAREGVPEGGEAAKRAVTTAVADEFGRLHDEAQEIRGRAMAVLAAKGITEQRFELEGGL